MANDVRALREEASQAAAAGKHKRALAAYLELERLESTDAQWAKRAGETYRRLGNNSLAIQAFNRSVERYAQNGFLVQAMKLLLDDNIAFPMFYRQRALGHANALQLPFQRYAYGANLRVWEWQWR